MKCIICSVELEPDGPDPEVCGYCYEVLQKCFCGRITIVAMIRTLARRIYAKKGE